MSCSSLRFKRRRVEEEEVLERKEGPLSMQQDCSLSPMSPLFNAANSSISVAHALGKVGTNLWTVVQSQLKDSAEQLTSSKQKINTLEEALLNEQIACAQSEFTSLALTSDLQRCTRSIQSLTTHLQGCSAEVAAVITSRVEDAVQHTYNSVQSQVDCERRQNSLLLRKVADVVSTTSNSLQHSNQELLKTRLALAQSDLELRTMKAKHVSEVEKSRGWLEEVELLLKMNRHLAEKAKTMESTTQDLSRAKNYIRQLEQGLRLPQIVQAVMAKPLTNTASGSDVQDTVSLAEKAVKDCRAMKFLVDEDLTIAELVDAWRMKEEERKSMEAREEGLKKTFLDLQRQVLVVHHHYLEEKQRRHMLDRRLAELARERLPHPSEADRELLHALQEFQGKYSAALDAKAELKVSLSLATNELTRLQEVNAQLKGRVEQLARDAESDHVANTLSSLRDLYAQKLDQMQKRIEEVEMEKNAYLAHSEATSALLERCQGTLSKSKKNFELLVHQLHQQPHLEHDTHGGGKPSSSRQVEATSGMPSLEKMASKALESIALLHQSLEKVKKGQPKSAYSKTKSKDGEGIFSTSSSLRTQSHDLPSESTILCIDAATTALKEASKELHQTATLFGRNGTSENTNMKIVHQIQSKENRERSEARAGKRYHDDNHEEEEDHSDHIANRAASIYKRETAMKTLEVMEKIVKEVLGFVATHVERTNVEKSSLIHRSLEDAQLIQTLTMTLERLGQEQEDLREQLQRSTALIELNHLAVLGHAQMKEITVEDSIDAEETAEHLVLLRTELETSQQTLAASKEELNLLRCRCESLEDESKREALRKKYMADELQDLKDALTASKKNEAAAVQRHVEVVQQLADLMRDDFKEAKNRIRNEETESQAESGSFWMPSEGEDHIENEQGVKESLNEASTTKSIVALQTSLKEQLELVTTLVQQASKSARESKEKEECKDSDLLWKGYSHVLTALRKTCHQLGLLKETKEMARTSSTREITKVYIAGEDLNVMEMTPECKIFTLTQEIAEKDKKQQRMAEEMEALRVQIQNDAEIMTKMKENEQRLLTMCKKMYMQHQKSKVVAVPFTSSPADFSTTNCGLSASVPESSEEGIFSDSTGSVEPSVVEVVATAQLTPESERSGEQSEGRTESTSVQTNPPEVTSQSPEHGDSSTSEE